MVFTLYYISLIFNRYFVLEFLHTCRNRVLKAD